MQSRALSCEKVKRCPVVRAKVEKIRLEKLSKSTNNTNMTELKLLTATRHFDVDEQCKMGDGCSSHLALSWNESLPNVELVRDNLRSLFSVFIVELYTESLCLLNYKLHKQLLKGCTCDDSKSFFAKYASASSTKKIKGKPKIISSHHVTHNEKHTSIDISDELAHKLDQLSQVDVVLYREVCARVPPPPSTNQLYNNNTVSTS
jgi:hypothetical protein